MPVGSGPPEGGGVTGGFAVGSGAEAGATSQFVEQTTPAYQGPLLIVAIIAFSAFILRELRAEQPLLDLRLFKQKTFSGASLVNLCVGFALIVALGVVPLFINAVVASNNPNATAAQILSDGAWYTGWVLSALTVTMAIMSVFIGRIVNRFGYRAPTLIGLLIAAIGFFITSRWTVETTYWQMVPGLMVAGLGFGMVLAPIATAVVNSAPAEERGVASALVIILRLVGMSLGGSIALSWGTQRVQTLSAELAAGQNQFAMDTLGIFRQSTAQAVGEAFLLFAVTACPPFGPFFSELLIVKSAFGTGHSWAAAGFLLCLLLAFLGLTRVVFAVVYGRPRQTGRELAARVPETLAVVLPPLALLLLALGLGVATPSVLRESWTAAVQQLTPTP